MHAVRVLASSAAGRGTPPVLATLDVALARRRRGRAAYGVARADDVLPPGWLSQGVPSDGRGARCGCSCAVPVETTAAGGSREDAVRTLLRTGAAGVRDGRGDARRCGTTSTTYSCSDVTFVNSSMPSGPSSRP